MADEQSASKLAHLQQPLTMSQFATLDDLCGAALRDRREAAELANELLEALKRIAANAKALRNDPEQSASSRRTWSICEEDARTAIAKAEV